MNFFRKIMLAIALLGILSTSAMVYARITHTLLVFDTQNEPALPGRFRMTIDPLPDNTNLQKEGLSDVHAAGSQQFCKDSLPKALERIPSSSVIVVDLRRESHGMLNGHAVSWYGPQNAANENKSPAQIKQSESRLLQRLKKSHYRWIYQIIEKTDDDYVDKASREFVLVNNVQSEEQLVESLHQGYQRFYIEDFHAPDDHDVMRFVNLVKNLPDTTWLYFHCRAGRGRTTTFMVLFDIMKNAKRVSLEDILKRQAALGGSDLRALPDASNFKYKYAAARLNLVKKFYEYARENNDNFSTTWQQWKRIKSVKSS